MRAEGARNSTLGAGPVGLKALWEAAAGLPRISGKDRVWHIVERAWSNVIRAPLTTLVSTLTIAVALLLLSVAVLVVQNVKSGLSASRQDLSVSLYLADGVTEGQARQMADSIGARSDVEKVRLLSKADALKEFQSVLGEQAVILDGLQGRNPLPITIEVRLRPAADGEPRYEAFAAEYRSQPEVEYVQYSSGLLQQVNALLKGLGWIGLLSIAVVLVLTGFIIANTIKLALYSHRDEIEIMRLVGATDRFIRAPYIIEGAAQGLLAGALGLVFTYLLFSLVRGVSHQLVVQGFMSAPLIFLSFPWMLFVLGVGVLVGIVGSWLAVRRFLPE